jgi:outer membrane protein OmpA-like peptidoglycan-associated protein
MDIIIRRKLTITAAMLVMAFAGMNIFGQATIKSVSDGEKIEVLGIINSRQPDSFVMTTLDGATAYNVAINDGTSVKTNTKGVFRGGKHYEATYLLRGLRVEVEGRGNSNGEIAADSVRFNEQDLKTAQALLSTLAPVEAQVGANKDNIAANKERIAAGEENAKKMAGQIDENTAAAQRAQGSADAAMAEAERANNRINGLDEFDTIKTIVVPFATGRYTIGPQGRKIIDEAAAWAKTQDRKGWMVSIVGFADSSGNGAANKTLSERRSNAVIGYLVSKHNMSLTRLIQPFGAGVDRPVASNDTAEGRAQNRRVEIHLLKNKGIAGTE